MATIVHFDINADDPERARNFYGELFGWKITTMPGFPGYYKIETADPGGKKGIGGGITKRENPQQTCITSFIGVSSIDKPIAKLSMAGRKVLRSMQVIPAYGYVAVCTDTENNIIGLFQEDKNAGHNV